MIKANVVEVRNIFITMTMIRLTIPMDCIWVMLGFLLLYKNLKTYYILRNQTLGRLILSSENISIEYVNEQVIIRYYPNNFCIITSKIYTKLVEIKWYKNVKNLQKILGIKKVINNFEDLLEHHKSTYMIEYLNTF